MWKKLLILSLCISVLFVFSAPISSVNAGSKKRNVRWRIAGTIAQFINIYAPNTDPNPKAPPLIDVGPHSLINLTAYGPPGPAKITLLSRSTGKESFFGCISTDYFPIGYFDKNDFIAMFPSQSLLFASIADEGGILCLNPIEGKTYFKVKMDITGGTGRFEGATGFLIGEGNGYPRSDVTLIGENGKITGEIIFDY